KVLLQPKLLYKDRGVGRRLDRTLFINRWGEREGSRRDIDRYLKINLDDSASQGWRAAGVGHRSELQPRQVRIDVIHGRADAGTQRHGAGNIRSTDRARRIGLPIAGSPYCDDGTAWRGIGWSIERPVLVDCGSLR